MKRSLISTLLAAVAILGGTLAPMTLSAATPIADELKIGGFAVGPQAYSFRFFTLFEAIDKTAQTGSRVIELGTGLKLSPERQDVFNHESSDEMIGIVQAKLKEKGIRALNYGVVAIPQDEAKARRIFDFAKKMDLPAIITESIDALDTIEKLAKEYDIRVGIHQHARKPNDPSYKIWEPAYVRSLVEKRDRRLGACADIGHWLTSGIKPIDGLKTLEGRVISLHMKDRAALGPNNHDVVFGTGVADIGGVLAELRRQNFSGNIAVEYEFNWHHSVPDIAQCIGFIRGWAAGQKK
ncbi:MAG TPA: sugar phosphate isomerase/epimerase [Opitutaceae bacterium]|nr:sugar phosphate isomerase/epimerase [Opitutaceae bacterium]